VPEPKEKAAAVLHTWVSAGFAEEVKTLAESEGRSVSNLIRQSLRAQIYAASPDGGGRATGGDLPHLAEAPAGSEGKDR